MFPKRIKIHQQLLNQILHQKGILVGIYCGGQVFHSLQNIYPKLVC
jgi:hypothetical protein